MLIDTHTHIYLNKLHSQSDILTNLQDDGVDHIISIGIDLPSSEKSIQLAKEYPGIVYATVGIHPTDVEQYRDSIDATLQALEEMILEHPESVKGVGECGFDFHWIDTTSEHEKKELQEVFFKKQILLAQKYNLPLVIHSRNSKEDTLRVLKEMHAKKFILHCYSEDLDFAYKAIYYSSECKLSFSGIVTYKSAQNVQNAAANIPLERILVETDCPFLSPQEVRGEENIPNYTKYNLKKVFELRQANGKKETWEQFEKQVYQNSKDIFGI